MPDNATIDKAIADALLSDGVITGVTLACGELAATRKGLPLDEALIDEGFCGEREVLRALAKAWHLQYLMFDKAEQLRIPDNVLEKIPVRIAEEHWIVPFRIAEEILWLITAAPVADDVLASLLRSTGTKAVNRLLVRRATAWACIRRHYYRDFAAFQKKPKAPSPPPPVSPDPQDPFDRVDIDTVSRTLRCPSCGAPATIQDFQCRACGLLLNPEARREKKGVSEQSVVRAMLSAGADEPRRRSGPDEGPTVKAVAPLEPNQIPVLIAGLDVAIRPINEFEAFVASFIDGAANAAEIARSAELSEVETHAILRSLVDRKIVELTRKVEAPPHIAKALEQARRDPATPAKGTQSAAMAKFEQVRTQSALQQAVTLERQGKVQEAIKVLRENIATLSQPAPLYNRLALVLLDQRGDHKAAEELLKKAVALEPKNEVYQRNLYKVISLAAVAALGITGEKPARR